MSIINPLTPPEREDFQKLFNKRVAKVDTKVAEMYAFTPVDRPPFQVNGSFYHLFGMASNAIPDDYLTDPAVMMAFQERNYYEQVRAVDDDFVPTLIPWLGTAVVASAFGCKVKFPPKQDPAVDPFHYPVQNPEDIKKLVVPDPEKDGLMPIVLEYQRYMRANSFLPVGITDCQGPLTTANQLMGYDKLIYLMYDHPNLMHQLMDVVTEALIVWIRKQKEVIGEGQTECFTEQQVYTGKNIGVWLSDDDAVLMSPKTYREFVVPYNGRIFREFGGGCLHFCGNATHHWKSFLETDSLRALNIYSVYNLKELIDLKSKVENRLVIYACDFTPADYQKYYRELLSGLSSYKGLMLDSQLSPIVALLEGGKYVTQERDLIDTRTAVFDFLNAQF